MGAWIEICMAQVFLMQLLSRTPRWVRGLKFVESATGAGMYRSHPTMGAWIEIMHGFGNAISSLGRTPRWVRGLKYAYLVTYV